MEACDPGHLHPGAELELETCDRRPDGPVDQAGQDPVGGQGCHQGFAGHIQLPLVEPVLTGAVQQA